ncbi:MAG: efflux RND transporter permease subunit [Rubripirellula sp.]
MLFDKNPRLLLLTIGIIVVSGSVAIALLPRLEDPRLTPRAARLITVLPGADPLRVESLVTEKLEQKLREIEEVKEISSETSTSLSFVAVELQDDVDQSNVESIWARIRDKADEAYLSMPPSTIKPDFKRFDVAANALIVALRWNLDSPPNHAVLNRHIKDLKDKLDAIPGTEKTELFGESIEEVLVTLDPDAMTSLGISAAEVSRVIASSDSKVSAGLMRSKTDNVLLEVSGELSTLNRLGDIPIRFGESSNFVQLSDIAKIEKTIQTPPDSKVLLKGKAAIAIGAQVTSTVRLDRWMQQTLPLLAEFRSELPPGVKLEIVFEQNQYVEARMQSLLQSLLFAAAAILVVIVLMMGWRCALIVGTALPIVSLMVLACMQALSIPIHQMSITGLIISLGLLIDNAIVVVDEIDRRRREGMSVSDAVRQSTSFLRLPLAGSTVTTVLSFSPIILMDGPAGEFVGSIAVVAVIAIISSYVVALTIIASLSRIGMSNSVGNQRNWVSQGISWSPLTKAYRSVINGMLRAPLIGITAGLTLPVLGFILALDLPEQFFPPSDRSQFQISIELGPTSSIEETEAIATQVRAELLSDERIEDVQWFLGESAPIFYYNVIPIRENASNYAQAIVDCKSGVHMRNLLREKQALLASQFSSATVLVRQLEQGPPFDAPIEVRLFGPDHDQLRSLGDEIRLVLSETPHVHSTISGVSDVLPKITFSVDEEQARLAGLDHLAIAQKLNTALEGITGGSIVEDTEELPVRVRVSGDRRSDINKIASLSVLAVSDGPKTDLSNTDLQSKGVPLSAISSLQLDAEMVSIDRRNGQRMNEVQGYIDAGVLPATVLNDFRSRLDKSSFELPHGYSIAYGGEDSERDDAVRSLLGSGLKIAMLMLAALVVPLRSFRFAGLLFLVAGLAVGLGLGSLWLAGYPWGFMSLVGIMGMIGVAVNDSIVVLAGIQDAKGDIDKITDRLLASTRHVLATSITTIVGFAPLVLWGGEFWSPVALTISGGVGGATLLALVFVPCAYMLIDRRTVTTLPSEWYSMRPLLSPRFESPSGSPEK